ncbi:MAG: HAMP domain-containing sensor histidine kinase [Burkholderiaceae bacterium]
MPRPSPAEPPIDWPGFVASLDVFAQATRLTVSAYDADGRRVHGPTVGDRFAAYLDEQGAWLEQGRARGLEDPLAARALASGADQRLMPVRGLELAALPMLDQGIPRGCVVAGWAFTTFVDSLAVRQLSHSLTLPERGLRDVMRMTAPMPRERFSMCIALLRNAIDAEMRHRVLRQELDSAYEARERLVARISHDLRTPLNAIQLRLEMLRFGQADDPRSVRESADKMLLNVRDLALLIDDLLENARRQHGESRLTRFPIDLRDPVRAALDTMRPIAQARDITIDAALDDSQPMPIVADAIRLRQVIWNLLSNAVKFSPPGERVLLTLIRIAHGYRLAVTDRGVGLAPGNRERIFEPFVTTADSAREGLGLGLAICRQIVQAHGGSIVADSDGLGKGARITVDLPAR